jgi:hypothetical protein
MKKSLVVFLVLGLMAALAVAPAQAKKKKKKPVRVERVVEAAYQAPGIGATVNGAGGGACPFADPTTQTCIEFPLQAGEKYVKVEITDATGGSVAGSVSQGDTDGDGIGNLYGQFCTAHPQPIPMESPSAPLRVSFYAGGSPDCVSTPTTGTIKVTFSNMP